MNIPQLHKMRLQHSPYLKIKTGAKTVELRLYDEKRQKIRADDCIEFSDTCTGEKLIVRVSALHRFPTFRELYDALPSDKIGYASGEKADPGDMTAYYSPEEQKKYGVIGIEMAVCENQGSVKLYFDQKTLLDTFLAHHTITPEQYNKSLSALTAKMNMAE